MYLRVKKDFFSWIHALFEPLVIIIPSPSLSTITATTIAMSLSLSLWLHHQTSSDFLSFTRTSIGLVKISLWTSLFTYPFIESFLGRTHSLPLTPYCLGTSGITLLATFRLFIIFTTCTWRRPNIWISELTGDSRDDLEHIQTISPHKHILGMGRMSQYALQRQ